MAIPTIYTGKHQAQPKLGAGAVLAPMAKAVLEETRRRELKREKNEAEFLKMAQTENPFNSISNATNEKMEQAMNDLLEWEAELYASTEGNLDVKQKLELTRKVKDHQNKIGRLQQAEMEVAQGLATAMKDPDKWDLGAAKEAYDNYIKTGEASNPLSPRPISPAEFYSNNPLSKDFFNIQEVTKEVGGESKTDVEKTLDKESKPFVLKVQSDLFSNEGLMKGAVNAFSSLPESKQKEYFKMAQENGVQAQDDLTGDDIVDARDNAVFLNHLDNVYESIPLGEKGKVKPKTQRQATKKGIGDITNPYTLSSTPQTYGDTTYNDIFTIPNARSSNVKVNKAKVVTSMDGENIGKTMTFNKTIPAKVVAVSKGTGTVIVKVDRTQLGEDDAVAIKADEIELPISEAVNLLPKASFKVGNKIMTMKQIEADYNKRLKSENTNGTANLY